MHRLTFFATASIFAALSLGSANATTNCDPARVMVLFDRSTSMIRGKIDDQYKWDIATKALKNVVGDYQSQTAIGLAVFPESDGTCKTGAKVVVDPPALMSLSPISQALAAWTPSGNSWTPIGQAVKELGGNATLNDKTKRRYVILVTDGAQSCPSGESDQIWGTTKIVEQVTALKSLGVKVFIIGFGANTSGAGDDGVDAYTLNQMAVAGGSSLRGCDPAGKDPGADNLCYYQADNDAGLAAALDEIALEISTEICDGLDNNCNGQIDEGLTQSCSTACGPGSQQCVMGHWGECSATMPEPEVCDGVDNNCNGIVDEGCACKNGDTKPCGTDKGECKAGVQRCLNGQWGMCDGSIGPSPEVCDGLDNDCDGITDPDCDCQDGAQRTCGGPDVGQCKSGTQTCHNGEWGDCDGAVGPSPEECDGVDNDCNGVTDNNNPVGDGDDLSNHLCNADQMCQNGHCVQVPPTNKPPTQVVTGGEATGCACRVGSSPGGTPLGGVLFAALAVGALIVRRSRRR